MLHAICESAQFAECALRFGWVRIRVKLGLGRVKVMIMIRFGSEICKLHMYDFGIVQHILHIAQID